ncbi:uncharacterized protein LOC111091708 isoform X1 [Canis lupus familiaris]|uniref:uncharacterized protein LOC111091708 isoform X1 n=1 Tax=Canis lupus familiaris TaxID=9615 RepID=UPI000BAA2D0B|nr:uncharacterized protein LOC111091708 isoform X1 [Canis lupus familiaris]XP_025297078.1 uncharacterized protein LOC112656094 isoform X1 [Canis lupus dingo]XP_038287365.1 uncharacterized protein LOC111091708 isoform X1 [Canis lupus familiaris]XP_038425949.1 uncharacterized protein LOC111091708 isoform X1 [Canis lupus familiaris]|eukprot:XP_022263856.1 uncharacterized protein LOC111091708 isoform X2 [Canis lupus familiaris]
MTWTLVTFIWEKAVLPPRAVQGRMKQKHIHSQSFNSASSYVLAVPVNCGGHLNILHGPHENAFGFAKMTSSTWSIVIIHTISSNLIFIKDKNFHVLCSLLCPQSLEQCHREMMKRAAKLLQRGMLLQKEHQVARLHRSLSSSHQHLHPSHVAHEGMSFVFSVLPLSLLIRQARVCVHSIPSLHVHALCPCVGKITYVCPITFLIWSKFLFIYSLFS